VFGNGTSGIIRMTKPPRKARLLQALARLKRLPLETYADLRSTTTSAAVEPPESLRTLFGNVLIAEGECASEFRPELVSRTVVQTTQLLRSCLSSSYNATI
jgi:hypothetical protein